MPEEMESRYLTIFENSPIALWEEDFSSVKEYLDDLKSRGVTDFNTYFDEHPDEVWECANLVEIKKVNQATINLQSVKSADELLGPLGRILHPDAIDLFQGEIVALAKGEFKFESLVELETVHNVPRHIYMVLSVPKIYRDTLELVIISMLDITETVNAKKMAEEALETAAFYNDLMAHDLSNMHQGIMSSMELMLESGLLPDKLTHLAEAALSQSRRGAKLISHVKKLAVVEEEEVDPMPMDPFESLSAAIEMVVHTFPRKDICVQTNLTQKQYYVKADEFLVDVFYNLLHNSARLDPEPIVNIDIHVEVTDNGFLLWRMSDRGPGIEDTMKKSILLAPSQKKKRVKGIGLTLVKRILERYGGDVWIEDSVEGDYTQGACFVMSLPLDSS